MNYTIKVVDKLVRNDAVIFVLDVPDTLSLVQDGDAVENFVAVHPYGLVVGGFAENPAGDTYEFPETEITVKAPNDAVATDPVHPYLFGTITLTNDTAVGATFNIGSD